MVYAHQEVAMVISARLLRLCIKIQLPNQLNFEAILD